MYLHFNTTNHMLLKEKLCLYMIFYKSTLALSFSFSAMAGAFGGLHYFFFVFGMSLMSGGTVLTLMYKEIVRPYEYYFYFNKGISKLQLFSCCSLLNLFIGCTLCFLTHA